jgi:type VI secretion system protein ImpM
MEQPVPPASGEDGQVPEGPGFFGKLPSHGDFITRRLPPALRSAWETWLDAGLERSREMLGDKWLASYLSSPIWCFAAAKGCCGEQPVAGVLMPSLDRVGRYFPLSILATVAAGHSPVEIALGARDWFGRMETVALSSLADGFDFADFEQALTGEAFPPLDGDAGGPLEIPAGAEEPFANLPLLLGRLLARGGAQYSLWWTSGSPAIAACCRAFDGLPPQGEFARLLG